MIEIESIGAIDTNTEQVERPGDAIGTEDNAILCASVDGHLHLVGEITEISRLGQAGLKKALSCCKGVIIASGEYTHTVYSSAGLIPLVVTCIIAQWVVECGCATGGLGKYAGQGRSGSRRVSC